MEGKNESLRMGVAGKINCRGREKTKPRWREKMKASDWGLQEKSSAGGKK